MKSFYLFSIVGLAALLFIIVASPTSSAAPVAASKAITTEAPSEKLAPISAQLAVAPSQDKPLAKKLSAAYAYELSIPKLGVTAPIRAMGLEPSGRMDVPDNYTEIGWYKHGTKPGAIGAAVLGAHVDNGSSVAGVFKNLKDLAIGDDIYTTDTDGKQLHFRVVDRKIYDRNIQDTREVMSATGVARLNLITCHGQWLPSENTYKERLVVFAELVS